MLGKAIKQENKYCKFGISPFGVWRNNDKDPEGSNTKAGVTNYDDLYANILLWLKNKWIDYVAPQIYWDFNYRNAPFGILTDWWADHSYGRHLYIGHGIYKFYEPNSAAWKNRNEIPNQIKKVRENSRVQGSIYYSSSIFNKNPNGWNDSLQNKYPAIIPPMPWIDSSKPAAPLISNAELTNDNNSKEVVLHFTVKNYSPGIKQYAIAITPKQSELSHSYLAKLLPAREELYVSVPAEFITGSDLFISLSAISKTNNQGEYTRQYNISWNGSNWVLK
jgi:hypothetical protein